MEEGGCRRDVDAYLTLSRRSSRPHARPRTKNRVRRVRYLRSESRLGLL
jgi:hypothetical protein